MQIECVVSSLAGRPGSMQCRGCLLCLKVWRAVRVQYYPGTSNSATKTFSFYHILHDSHGTCGEVRYHQPTQDQTRSPLVSSSSPHTLSWSICVLVTQRWRTWPCMIGLESRGAEHALLLLTASYG